MRMKTMRKTKVSLFLALGLIARAALSEGIQTYCIIDLSAGATAVSYPVTYLDAEPAGGFNTTEYKTTKLVLRRISAGTFTMGNDQKSKAHRVTLTQPFYMGLFEVTQKQWELVMELNSSPSEFKGEARPVEQVSYVDIRGWEQGSQWPASNAVDDDSFLGRLRTKTKLDFDLPTSAQWEYACRAGSTTAYWWGKKMDGHSAWYDGNANAQTHEVGMKSANPWGLYDINGNVWEWCLDWYGNLSYGTDPKGPASGVWREFRGGGWETVAAECNSTYRDQNGPWTQDPDIGFRLVLTLERTDLTPDPDAPSPSSRSPSR